MDTRRLAALSIVLTSVLAAGGCAVKKYDFVYEPRSTTDVGSGAAVVLLAVSDQRPEVLGQGGKEKPTWVGIQRGGYYGAKFDVHTASGRPFAVDVADILKQDLTAAGFRVLTVTDSRAQDVAAALKAQGAERGLAIVLKAYHSDALGRIVVEWDFEATAYGANGETLATNESSGKKEMKGSAWNPTKVANKKIPPFVADVLRELVVGNAGMVKALGNS
jgi:hypothetical protein